MNNKRKKIISFLMAFAMILSTLNFNLINSNKVYAEKMNNVQTASTVNDAIEAIIDCMNKDYYSSKGGSLEGEAYASMYRARADIEKKGWSVKKDTSSFGLKAFGSKVTQALALMDLNEDPTTYKDVKLISDVAEEISKVSSPKDMGINEVKGLILLDRYNEKFSDKKVDYNVENAIKNLIGAQKEDGSINSVPQNTAAALVVLNKHKDIEGVNDCIAKALDYVHKSQRDDGGILTSRSFSTKINAESVSYLVSLGEDLTSEEWTKNGKTSIDALFTLWNGKGFENSYGGKDYYTIPKVLDALVSLKEAGYGNCQIKGVKFHTIKKEEPKKNGSSITSIINGVIDYYNTEHFITNQGQLVGFEYSAMAKAGADLTKKQWYLNKKYESFDKDLNYVGSKANQSLILIDLGEDPNNYNGRHLIDEIVEKVDKNDSYFGQREINAVIALDKYNEKFKERKVNYNVEHAVEKILEAQCEDGGFKERGNSSVVINTGYALMALSKHKDIKGVDEAISKALTYLQGVQKEDGGLYDTTFVTGYHSEVLRGIIAVGENPTSKEWTKPSEKNPVDALFTLWKDNNSFNGKQGESINNRGWVEATWKALYTLVDLKDASYGEYVVDGIKVKGISHGKDENEEKTCKVNVIIAIPEGGKYECYFKPQEVTISDKKHDKGFTALGALQAATTLYQMRGDMVTSIYGYENAGLNGWMYTVNGIVPNEMAGKVSVKDGDKIIWYYSMSSMEGKSPTWEELSGKDTSTETENNIFNVNIKNVELKKGQDGKVEISAENNTESAKKVVLIVALYDKDMRKMINYNYIIKTIDAKKTENMGSGFSIPEKGNYEVKAMVWDNMNDMNGVVDPIVIKVK